MLGSCPRYRSERPSSATTSKAAICSSELVGIALESGRGGVDADPTGRSLSRKPDLPLGMRTLRGVWDPIFVGPK